MFRKSDCRLPLMYERGAVLSAVIYFIVFMAVLYFLIVVPYKKMMP